MSFNTKRAICTLSSTSRSKPKHLETENYTISDLPSLRRKRTIALNRLTKH